MDIGHYWETSKKHGKILKPGTGQANLNSGEYLTLISGEEGDPPGIVLDFGKEIQGGLEIVPTYQAPDEVKVIVKR